MGRARLRCGEDEGVGGARERGRGLMGWDGGGLPRAATTGTDDFFPEISTSLIGPPPPTPDDDFRGIGGDRGIRILRRGATNSNSR